MDGTTATEPPGARPQPPTLRGPRSVLRPGSDDDALLLHRIRCEPTVAAWWGIADPVETIAAELRGEAEETLFVVEVDGEVAGAIQYSEENEPDNWHAGIDLYLSERFQGRGLGSEAVAVLAAHLVDDRGHHRLTIDPSRDNVRAVRAYERVGFRPVGVMRRYERAPDGTWRDGLLMDLLAEELVRPVNP
jgi:aminoglycoside 6'-N-acetyltransferase